MHNAARFGTEDEAASTLFGVEKGVYTGVDERPRLIEQGDGKVLFLDEAHNYPKRIQKSLLRAMEEQRTTRIGGTHSRPVNIRYAFASNQPPPRYGLAHDLLARLRVVALPPLIERVADIPSLFLHLARQALCRAGVRAGEVPALFEADHLESLCIDGFREDNTRGVIRVAEEIAEEILDGLTPEAAVRRVFERRYGRGPVVTRGAGETPFRRTAAPARSPNLPRDPAAREQEILRQTRLDQAQLNLIRRAYDACDGDVTAMDRELRSLHGLRFSRRRIAKILDTAGLPRVRKPRS